MDRYYGCENCHFINECSKEEKEKNTNGCISFAFKTESEDK